MEAARRIVRGLRSKAPHVEIFVPGRASSQPIQGSEKRGGKATRTTLVAAADSRTARPGLSRGPQHAHLSRNDLSIPVYPSQRRVTQGTHHVLTNGSCSTASSSTNRAARSIARHGDDQRPSARSRGPCRPRPLGRRFDHWQRRKVCHRDAGRTDKSLSPARAPTRWASCRAGALRPHT